MILIELINYIEQKRMPSFVIRRHPFYRENENQSTYFEFKLLDRTFIVNRDFFDMST